MDRARTEILPSTRDEVDSAGPERECAAAVRPLVDFELVARVETSPSRLSLSIK